MKETSEKARRLGLEADRLLSSDLWAEISARLSETKRAVTARIVNGCKNGSLNANELGYCAGVAAASTHASDILVEIAKEGREAEDDEA